MGRFVLLPVSAYPLLEESDRNGMEHDGWSVKIKALGARGHSLWLEEKGETPTGFSLQAVKKKKKGFIEYTSTRRRVPARTRDSQD